jgi:dynein heavy chain
VISNEGKTDLTKAPEDGVYIHGLYVEGCRWDERKEALEESQPKILFTQMKSIWVLPKKKDDIDYGHSYMCPVYKTARRAGTLSTTGHSTNFVLYIYLPM